MPLTEEKTLLLPATNIPAQSAALLAWRYQRDVAPEQAIRLRFLGLPDYCRRIRTILERRYARLPN